MKRKPYEECSQSELYYRLKKRDEEVEKLKSELKKMKNENADLAETNERLSNHNRSLTENADNGFINSVERLQILEKLDLVQAFWNYEKVSSASILKERNEYKAKYSLLLSQLEGEKADIFEEQLNSTELWKDYEKIKAKLEAENSRKDLTIHQLQENLDKAIEEIATLKHQLENNSPVGVVKEKRNERNAGRKALAKEIQLQIQQMYATPKENGSYPTIAEIANQLGVSLSTVHKYIDKDFRKLKNENI